MRVGSLCTGYGGLDLAIGGELVFTSEIDPHASKVIDRRFPGVPNLGDLTTLDGLPDCDVVTAGFPCQPFSLAGQGRGTEDERWLWDDIERVLGGMDRPPGFVFLENVRALLTANGGYAMARVVSGLARLGFVGSYRVVSAADVGACHRRERVFILARHPEGRGRDVSRVERSGEHRESEGPAGRSGSDARPERYGPYAPAVARWERIIGRPAPTPTYTDGRGRGADEPDIQPREPNPARLNPRFVEHMMGLPDGWVTDCDIPRTAQLRILGNGVVPQQARAAWDMMADYKVEVCDAV